jgi:uncharacterized protein (TIGR00369 family)
MGTEEDVRLADVRDRITRSAFHRWAGLRLERVAPGEVEVALDASEHHLNLLGAVHGGMIATLADTAMGLAVRTRLEPGTTHVTSTLTVTYLAPGRPGSIHALGRAVKSGRQLSYAEADLRDGRGRRIARASATFVVLRERPERERRAQRGPTDQ